MTLSHFSKDALRMKHHCLVESLDDKKVRLAKNQKKKIVYRENEEYVNSENNDRCHRYNLRKRYETESQRYKRLRYIRSNIASQTSSERRRRHA